MEGDKNTNQDLISPLLQPSSPRRSSNSSDDDANDRYDSVSASVKGDLTRTSFVNSIAQSLMGGEPRQSAEEGGDDENIGVPRRELNVVTLGVLIFYNVAGGPFGFEPSIKAAGNLYAIIAFASMPFIWAIPEAIMTYELSSTYPCASGGVRWLEEAFGERWGMIAGYLGWIGGVTNNATFPVLFLNYILHQFYPDRVIEDDLNPWVRWGILALITISLSYINYRGLGLVGKTTFVFFIISIAPIILMVILGIPKVDPQKWLQTPPVDNVESFDDDALNQRGWFPVDTLGGIALSPFINNVFWNFNNIDQAAHYSSSVPKKTFKRGVLLSVFLIPMAYLLPILMVTGATDLEQDDWTSGSLAVAASIIGGRWLGNWVVLSSGIGLLGSFFAEMSADTMQIMGMADRAQIPSIFSHRSPYNTPTFSILLSMTIILVLVALQFSFIVELSNFSYCLSITLEFSAYIKLRVIEGDASSMRKAFCVILVILPILYNLLVLALASYATYIYGVVMVVFGLLLVNARSIRYICWRCFNVSKTRRSDDMMGESINDGDNESGSRGNAV